MNRIFVFAVLLLTISLMVVACDQNNEAAYGVDELPETASVDNGEKIFREGADGAPNCIACHTLDGEDTSSGPSLQGIANNAGDRVGGESAEEYLLNSIIAPGAHLADGYGNRMFGSYDDRLSKQQIADVVAYLMTLD